MRPLSNDLQKIAKEELNEDVNRIPADLKHIKDWLAKQPHLNARTDDQWLLTFLRGCKYSLERTKEKIDFYYTVRGLCPEFYNNRDPFLPEIQEILRMGLFLPLPKLTPTSQRVIFLNHGLNDPDKIKIANVLKTHLMSLDIILNEDDHYTIAGTVVVQDMKDSSLSYLAHSPIDVLKKFTTAAQYGYTTRPKALYFVNIPSYFETILSFFRAFLTEKNKSRIKAFKEKDIEKFYSEFPRSILPKEYGGEAGPIDKLAADWKKKVESYRDWFLEDQKYCSNEKKRPGKPKTSDELFGLDGSFRKLEID